MTLNLGAKAPRFSLKDKDGDLFALQDVRTDYTVIFFYPKDNTPGCTIEAKGFNVELARFKKLSVTVIGISGGDEASKSKFCKKHGLKLTLLSDPDFSVAKKYGAFGERSFMGRRFNGILRSTYILDRDHRVLKVFEKVKPTLHPKEVYEFIVNTSRS